MIKLEKKQIKIFSVVIAAVFIGSVVALALTQMGGMGSTVSAASSSIGVVDYRQVMSQSTAVQDANTQMQLAVEEAKNDFESKTAGMSEEEKANYYQETQDRLAQKQQSLLEPIHKQVEAAVKKAAEAKGLSVVIDKGAVVYGGQDITQDVISKMAN